MAIIKCGALVADIRGKVGTNVFSRNQGGAIVRDLGSWVQPDNEAQQACRDAIITLSAVWSSTLTETERQTWKSYATTNPRPNRWGTASLTNGFTAFIRHNFHENQDTGSIPFISAPTSGPIHPPRLTIVVQQNGCLKITGTSNPSINGTYHPDLPYQLHPLWGRSDTLSWIWTDTANEEWFISAAPGATGGPYWTCATGPAGSYTPHGGATGTAAAAWHYDSSLARITSPPANYPDPPPGLKLFLYSGIPLAAGRSYFSGPFLKLISLPPELAAVPSTYWCRWTWPTRSVEPPWSWQPDGSGTARYYAIAQDTNTGAMSTRFIGTPTFGSLTPW